MSTASSVALPNPFLNDIKTVINDLSGKTISATVISISPPPRLPLAITVNIPSGGAHAFELVGSLVLTGPDGVKAHAELQGGNQIFYASQVFRNSPIPLITHEISFPPPFSNILGNLKTVVNNIKDLTVKYELIIPGGVKLEPLPLHRPEILPGASHTFQLGPIGVDLILIGDDGESKHVALTAGDQAIYTSEYFIIIGPIIEPPNQK